MAIAILSASSCSANEPRPTGERTVVVVELFTSEGCSSCPPADALLAELAKPDAVAGVDIVPLEMHVDYWNRLGWADPYSSAAFSGRQEAYARRFSTNDLYTPQMVVDGKAGFVGSDRVKAMDAIANAANAIKGKITLGVSPLSPDGKTAECSMTITGLGPNVAGKMMLAITEDGLSTDVPRGENAGRNLSHTAVVRSLAPVASINPAGASPYSVKATIHLLPAWKANALQVNVFVEEEKSGKIIAATRTALTPAKGK